MINLEEFVETPYSKDYLVSREGQVYSRKSNKLLSTKGKGYLGVSFLNNGISKSHKIHRLVAVCFIDKDYVSKGLVVNHKDGNKQNNNLWNLELITNVENLKHAHATGLMINSARKGELNVRAKLKEDQVVEIFKNRSVLTDIEQSKKYNVSRNLIGYIRRRTLWTHVTDKIL